MIGQNGGQGGRKPCCALTHSFVLRITGIDKRWGVESDKRAKIAVFYLKPYIVEHVKLCHFGKRAKTDFQCSMPSSLCKNTKLLFINILPYVSLEDDPSFSRFVR